MTRSPADDPSWTLYSQTVLEIESDTGHCTVDLRKPVGEMVRGALARCGLQQPFAIVTACDPHGRPLPPGENAQRTATLGTELRLAGVLLATVTGRSPDGQHAEPGFACALPRSEAVALARAWGQSALFWFDGDRFSLLGGYVEAPDTPLPVGAPHASGTAPDPAGRG